MMNFLHRWIWQSIPRSWRRAALFNATSVLAPGCSKGASPAEPVIVVGALRTASGLGESARLCHDALKQSGVAVYGIDLTTALMQPPDHPFLDFADGASLEGPGTLILHVNSPLVPMALWHLGRRVVRGKYLVGYWHWELPRCPSEYLHGVPFVHEIWVPSTFTADALRPLAAGRPIRVLPHPVGLKAPPRAPRGEVAERPFTVLTLFSMASSCARKNPLAAIAAFRTAFGADPSCRLIVKIAGGQIFPGGMASIVRAIGGAPNIVLIDRSMSAAEIDDLYRDSDVVMSLHRSEGFGLVVAEAMLRGLPVIATDWSGTVDFVSPEWGFPIPYRLVPAEDPQDTYHHPDVKWADADVDAAADALRRLRSEPGVARALGTAGAVHAARVWSVAAYGDAVRAGLRL